MKRKLNLLKNTVVPFIITAMNQIVKIIPVGGKDGLYFCLFTSKSLNTIIKKFNGK